jgi:signal transduction protein with GAF and PtsI domain
MDKNTSLHVPWVQIVNLLSDLVVYKHYDFNEFLRKMIKIINTLIPVDACLIYFYDREKNELILVGSNKAHEDLLEKITLKKGEGITGWVLEHNKTVAIATNAYLDPRFKSFHELPEDTFESFLSVPVKDENGIVGVVNMQSKKPYDFSNQQIQSVEAIMKIIASAFTKVVLERKVGRLENKLKERQIIDEAKGVLMKVKNIDENEAYHHLRNEAMVKRKTMREIAEAILLVLK